MVTSTTTRLSGVAGALAIKAPCRVGTTANITLSGLQTVDGVALVDNDRVLVKNQTYGTENGIYVVSSGDWQRAKDFDGNRDVVQGTRVLVVEGDTNRLTEWIVTSSGPVLPGASSITFQVTGLGPLAQFANGTEAAPGLASASDPGSGIYRIGPDNLGVSIAGSKVLDISAAGLANTEGIVNGAPTGFIGVWPTDTAPTGWLICNGAAVSRTVFAALFAVIGTTYGAGDGSTTFNLPDYRGEFLRGSDNGAGIDPDAGSRTDRGDGVTGDNVGTKQAEETKSHTHTGTTDGHTHQYERGADAFLNVFTGGVGISQNNPTTETTQSATDTFTSDSTGGGETRPRNVGVNWIIRT